MHRIAATPGGWNPQAEGVIFIEQTPAPIVFITAADTDIQTLATAIKKLPPDFPSIRVANLLQLQQQLTIDTYAEDILSKAKVIILRLLGGRSYWSYGLEVVGEIVEETETKLIVMPGDDRPDPDLMTASNISLSAVNKIWQYLTEGGIDNFVNCLKFTADICLQKSYDYSPPKTVPRIGVYRWQKSPQLPITNSSPPLARGAGGDPIPKIGILFYRAHYLSGNVGAIDGLCQALAEQNLEPVAIFISSGRDPEIRAELLEYFQGENGGNIQLLLDTTSFSISGINNWENSQTCHPIFQSKNNENFLDIPVFQVILSGGTKEQWQSQFQGLSPRDVAMNVALPEVDGNIITRAVSFKGVESWNEDLETDVVGYVPESDRLNFVAKLTANWVKLKQTPAAERRVALILANYPNRDGRLANGVGLDTPASCIEILRALGDAGYFVKDIPATGDELIKRLTSGVTNDPEGRDLRVVNQSLSLAEYRGFFASLPEEIQAAITQRWGLAADFVTDLTDGLLVGEEGWLAADFVTDLADGFLVGEKVSGGTFPIPGIQLGNIFVGVQPSRGYDIDPSLNYHAPDLEPTHSYLAFYYWLREHFAADAIAHVGKHGNLEWLPGKSVGLSAKCYPEVALGALPHFYPFIVNDPGEGSQAKRRSQGVIIDHLTPPMTRAELYGPLQKLETLIDEYYEAQSIDPSRLPVIRDRLLELLREENLDKDLSFATKKTSEIADFITNADSYLCELKEAQIRDGLHIFGQCPQGRQLRDLIIAIARHPSSDRLGLTRALAADLDLDIDPLTADFSEVVKENLVINNKLRLTVGDVVECLENKAAELVEELLEKTNSPTKNPSVKSVTKSAANQPLSPTKNPSVKSVTKSAANQPFSPTKSATRTGETSVLRELKWINNYLLPSLLKTSQETDNLLRGLEGKYIPAGSSGAPTRGRADVLPTGRNFYSVDIRAIPTETAWRVGELAADRLIERYTQENGEYPQTLGLSVWGTSTMRTGGDDIAEALALLGVKPVWDGPSRRVIDFEILPISILGRPRVDVTLRISGFFRDAFPNIIDLFDRAVIAVANLEELPTDNPLAERVKIETQSWEEKGLNWERAKERSLYRIFGSKPGAYGAGLQGLIEAQNWQSDEDLAKAYINWSSYAYTATSNRGKYESRVTNAPEAFQQRLGEMQIVLHNQDNREHDLLDSDDYYQFQGGMTAAVRSLKGKNPQTYFGDNSMPENPKVRQLQEEILRVYRSRVVNPKWIDGVMRHGYKGAFEIAATVDYLFAYDATANCVEDFVYEGVAEAYLFDEKVREFIKEKNPWGLRDIAERLLEANQRGLWQSASEQIIDELRAIALEAEGDIEAGNLL
jgi:cobaltochelatase CobN